MKKAAHVIVAGAGISGLTAAWWLHRAGVPVTVLESGTQPGGTMQTVKEGEWLIETGPNSALETTPLFGQMFEQLGILDQRIYARVEANKRYILRDGRLHALPMSPGAFLGSRLWSMSAKLRLLREPLIGRGSPEESVAQFVERRLGKEFLDYAINPFVAGVYAGNPEQLSVRAAFPKLYALEEKYGGLIMGMIKGARERRRRAEKAKDRARMFSFVDGMQVFPRAIAAHLGERVQYQCVVESLRRSDDGLYVEGDGFDLPPADHVILSVPAHVASHLVEHISSRHAGLLSEISYPPVVEVFLGYRMEQIHRKLDGFGYLIPQKERQRILGTIWSSVIFPNRAPAGHVAFTTFVGGSRQPEITQRDDASLIGLVSDDVASLVGISGAPVFTKVIRWGRAIPQYNLGYDKVLRGMEDLERSVPGLHLCSNYRGGIAVGDCVMSGERVARKILEQSGVTATVGANSFV